MRKSSNVTDKEVAVLKSEIVLYRRFVRGLIAALLFAMGLGTYSSLVHYPKKLAEEVEKEVKKNVPPEVRRQIGPQTIAELESARDEAQKLVKTLEEKVAAADLLMTRLDESTLLSIQNQLDEVFRDVEAIEEKTKSISTVGDETHLKGALLVFDDNNEGYLRIWNHGQSSLRSYGTDGKTPSTIRLIGGETFSEDYVDENKK